MTVYVAYLVGLVGLVGSDHVRLGLDAPLRYRYGSDWTGLYQWGMLV